MRPASDSAPSDATRLRGALAHAFGDLPPADLDALAALFEEKPVSRGTCLFSEGDAATQVFVLLAGRLRVSVGSYDTTRVIGEIGPGETVGEVGAVTGRPRSATVEAVKESLLAVCSREKFMGLAEQRPQLLMRLIGIVADRARQAERLPSTLTITIVPLSSGAHVQAFVNDLRRALEEQGRTSLLNREGAGEGGDADAHATGSGFLERLDHLSTGADHLLYFAEGRVGPFVERGITQADRIVLLADADDPPARREVEERLASWLGPVPTATHLVLLHPAGRAHPTGTARWLDERTLTAHHHARSGRADDAARVARHLTGCPVGLVLGGGGARGAGHIGVIRALQEHGVPIDTIAGTSSGAAVACQFGLTLDTALVQEENRKSFIANRPFRRLSLPWVSLVSREALDRVALDTWGDLDLADLWLPISAVSCDISQSRRVLHRRGPVWEAVRASTALPGIATPLFASQGVLVDGGVIDNVPTRELSESCGGGLVAVDIAPEEAIAVDYAHLALPSPWVLLWRRFRPWGKAPAVPTLVEVLLRSFTVASAARRAALEQEADLVLRPPLAAYGLLDFDKLDEMVAAAYADALPRVAAFKSAQQARSAGNKALAWARPSST